ncbi:hypothetical protein ACQ4LE_002568 [Meloidogyne hapla]|uniref:Guanylate kinase-like domain-containing protein n=1 Tax=Meloidogyne hapla TaxID=6305 RepID=A0A1I8BZ84_MELHA
MADNEEFIKEMRGNAGRLSDCLSSLLRRIEQLETQKIIKNIEINSNENEEKLISSPTFLTNKLLNGGFYDDNELTSNNTSRREYLSVDPFSGQRKLITIIERSLPNGPLRAQSPTQLNGPEAEQLIQSKKHLLASAYESRIVEIKPNLLEGLELEQICGQFVAVKVTPELSKIIRPGDTLIELDGQPFINKKQLYQPKGAVQLKLVLSDFYSAPMEFCKVLDNYKSNIISENSNQLPYLSFSLQRGDILQILSKNENYFQARKVNDLSTSGFVPKNIRTCPVAMLCPYGRRVIALIGANGVGRRTLKRMLIEYRPYQFAGVIPITSRAPKQGEQQGREYFFERKEDVLQLIRDRKMIEWGEYNDQLYGTTAESIRQVIRSGRVCVLDCSPKAISNLYNSEFMPFIVVIASPELDEIVQLNGEQKTNNLENLRNICEQSSKFLNENEWAKQADLLLINRNRDISLRRLLDSLESLKSESQWIPLEWLQTNLPK